MTYRVVFSEGARSDLEEIRVYLEWYSTAAYRRLLVELKEIAHMLRDFPRLYPQVERAGGYRQIAVEGYLVLYDVDDDRRKVTIRVIAHGSRDIGKFLEARASEDGSQSL